jgi:hypothetical protein
MPKCFPSWFFLNSPDQGLLFYLENGKPDALQRARKKANDIISSHAVPPLPDDIARKVKSILPNI